MNSIRLPAEWEPQAAVWLAWPHNRNTWPGNVEASSSSPSSRTADPRPLTRFQRIPPFFERWARIIAETTPVRILCPDSEPTENRFRASNIQWVDIPTNDCWVRDYGPTFVFCSGDVCTGDGENRNRPAVAVDTKHSDVSVTRDQTLCAIDWRYNAWGGKYPPWDQDDAAASRIASHLEIPVVQDDLCLEGGALETDGAGRLLTTTSCVLSPTRNPSLSRQQIERRLFDRLGLNEVVWLDGALAGDDTDGHIDQLARFIDPQNVVVASCEDRHDENNAPLQRLHHQLNGWAEQTSPRPTVHSLPIPPPRTIDDQRVPESYCNLMWLGRDRLLVPTFGNRTSDDRAIGILRELVAHLGTEVIGIDCQDLVWGLGALHCASREQPAILR